MIPTAQWCCDQSCHLSSGQSITTLELKKHLFGWVAATKVEQLHQVWIHTWFICFALHQTPI
jgi:hypothetical protein